MTSPILLDRELCVRHKDRLAAFYYSNMRLCSFMDGFTYEDAVAKIECMTKHVSEGTAMVFGVFDQERLIAFLWAYEHPYREEPRVYVSELHVDEEYRGRGIGKKLLAATEQMARERGYHALYIHAEGNNDGALSLYESQGYVTERIQLRKEL